MSDLINVFIADDHEVVISGVKSILNGSGYIQVKQSANCGKEAYRWMINNDFDVAVLDISIKAMSGIDVMKKILVNKPKSKIIIMSMHPAEVFAYECIRLGAKGYLNKDRCDFELIDAIEMVHNGRKYINKQAAEAIANSINSTSSELSKNEIDVFKLLVDGVTPAEIALRLNLSEKTISARKVSAMRKLNASTTEQAVSYCLQRNIF